MKLEAMTRDVNGAVALTTVEGADYAVAFERARAVSEGSKLLWVRTVS